MGDIRLHIDVELANIEKVIGSLPSADTMPDLSTLELAGVAALLHSFYSGVENILKQVLKHKEKDLPTGPSWHKEMIEAAVACGAISVDTANGMKEYLAFRHFFSHAYALDLDPERLFPLVDKIDKVYGQLNVDIDAFLTSGI